MATTGIDPGGLMRPRDASPGDPASEFERLRALLNAPERRLIAELAARFEDQARAREISLVLPEAVALRSADPQLTRALTPSVEEAITSSVRRNPKPLADALFPVMGPAIRRAIAHALGTMIETLNRTVEHSLSWRALKWRWTALRSGRPYAEVVLLDTLLYRVEQLFLVHRESGLLLQHVAADGLPTQDPDLVSGMLTAIRDFVQDSFGTREEAVVDVLKVGELSVIVEQGPLAMLAAVVRGTPPPTLRATLQDALETIHLHHADDLAGFAGDHAPFDASRPVLQACLQMQYRGAGERHSRLWLWILLAVLASLVAWGVWSWWRHRQFEAYLATLRDEPGLVVVDSGRRGGRFFVSGLRDPLAKEPTAILAASGLAPGPVEARWLTYQALDPPFVVARAREVLHPTGEVTLDLRDGVLHASGTAASRWIADAERLARLVPGVRRFDASAVVDADLARVSRGLGSATLSFRKGRASLVGGQDETIAQVSAWLRELDAIASTRGLPLVIETVGHTDEDGTPEANLALSEARARAALGFLGQERWRALTATVRGIGSREPMVTGGTEGDKQRNRRVSFRVIERPAAGHEGR